MVPLLSVLACHHRAPHLTACRNTWLKDCDLNYKFFFGRGSHEPLQEDEIILDCDDAYRGLACKVQSSVKWALENDYDAFFKMDDDTYIRTERLANALVDDWAQYDFVGRKCEPGGQYHLHAYARGGTGYYLSRRSMEAIAAAPIPNPNIPSEYAEDFWVAKTLKNAGIDVVNDDRLRCAEMSGPNRTPRPTGFQGWKKDVPMKHNRYITVCEFLGSEMYPVHDEWERSNDKHSSLMGRLRIK